MPQEYTAACHSERSQGSCFANLPYSQGTLSQRLNRSVPQNDRFGATPPGEKTDRFKSLWSKVHPLPCSGVRCFLGCGRRLPPAAIVVWNLISAPLGLCGYASCVRACRSRLSGCFLRSQLPVSSTPGSSSSGKFPHRVGTAQPLGTRRRGSPLAGTLSPNRV